jgi:predicted transcriptional regulator
VTVVTGTIADAYRLDNCLAGGDNGGMPIITGPELRRERRAKELSVVAVAGLMGVSRQTVHAYERAADPGADVVKAYRAALRTLRADNVSTPEAVA